jgi:hypothetical protein
VNDCVALVILTRQSWKIETAIRTLAKKTVAVIVFDCALHDGENTAGPGRLLRFSIVASDVSRIMLHSLPPVLGMVR